MLDRTQTEELRKAIETSTIGGVETHSGECYAETPSQEYGYRWHDGEAVVYHESDDESPNAEYVFRVRVELVAVKPTH